MQPVQFCCNQCKDFGLISIGWTTQACNRRGRSGVGDVIVDAVGVGVVDGVGDVIVDGSLD